MPLTSFHPALQRWFNASFDGPSPPQAAGWPLIARGLDTLICAPTGSGKTLTAFMACLDSLLRQSLHGSLTDETQVVYVSPLKALSNDIQKNLREPLDGICKAAHEMGMLVPEIRVVVRTGDTLASERQLMLKRPPHILVTTPESLFILLTAAKSRERLKNVRTVIVDEIHAVAKDKRGAHLALTLERLDALCQKPPQRIGLSATQRPVELVAEFLVGNKRRNPDGSARCEIINLGHLRKVDVSIEIPEIPLESVCSYETWGNVHDRLTELIKANRTTLIFVNTRSLCERLAKQLTERLGPDKVTSHHGSMSRLHRLAAEEQLKAGSLSALVATSSLELGIDIGSVDLVCQIGVTHSISALLQRVGRSGHSLTGISRGKLFPLTIDELTSAAALNSAIRRGHMDILHIPPHPRDILAQQIVAAAAAEDWDEEQLFELVKGAYNYRDLPRKEFDDIIQMLADGFTTRRGRRSALLHHDRIGKRIHARRGARLAAITSGGAIPDTADYQVVQDPEGIVVGSLDEHFAIDSSPGDIFQLGNTTWQILKIETGKVRVKDARGQPPNLPFWFGEAPARTDELSAELSRVRAEIELKIESGGVEDAIAWLMDESGMERRAAEQVCVYLAESKKVLGVIPTTRTLVLERFFDESGGMQLILHAPFGRRINWAWGLALRKRFCRGFNFELQAAASENSILLSLGPQHSFPLGDVFHYLKENTVETLLIQAALESPTFQTRWRWDACRSLALLRFSGGKKVPPHLLRMRSDDLMAAVFPHAAACPENLPGDREVPDHPLVREVIYDCMHEAMDLDGLKRTLAGIDSGELKLVARDTVEPSTLAHEILAARPYSFLDDAGLEERRTRAVIVRRGLSREDARTVGALDAGAIERVRDECRVEPRDVDELHDVLMTIFYLLDSEAQPFAANMKKLAAAGRATQCRPAGRDETFWIATERVPVFEAAYPGAQIEPSVNVPGADRAKEWTQEAAVAEIVRGRVEVSGPLTTASLAAEMALPESDIEQAMLLLESQGVVMRGHFTPGVQANEWCDRRLLARIHRYTLDRLRREIEPVAPGDFLRFLFSWQHLDPDNQLEGVGGVSEAIAQLQGFEIASAAWERDVLPARVKAYDKRWLDQLSLSGEISWGRRFPAPPAPVAQASSLHETGRLEACATGKRHSGQVRSSPIGLFLRDQLETWLELARELPIDEAHLSGAARQVLELIRRRGAMFFQNLVRETKRLPSEMESALSELVACGYVTGDGFGGLRALLTAAKDAKRKRRRSRFTRYSNIESQLRVVDPRPGMQPAGNTLSAAGRWSLFRGDGQPGLFGKASKEEVIETVAKQLLRRWGVVFHRVLARETGLPNWLEILRVYRRMEARGEVRGGRFVAGFSGEQYALPEAVERMRAIRKAPPNGKLISISGSDPLNLLSIIIPGERVASRSSSRIVFRDGIPVAIKESSSVRILEQNPSSETTRDIYAALIRKAI